MTVEVGTGKGIRILDMWNSSQLNFSVLIVCFCLSVHFYNPDRLIPLSVDEVGEVSGTNWFQGPRALTFDVLSAMTKSAFVGPKFMPFTFFVVLAD